jgi:deoxycytidylate deaminase
MKSKKTINLSPNILSSVINTAFNSDLRCLHGAVLINKRNIVASGHNHKRSSFRGRICMAIHAEEDAIRTFYNHHITFLPCLRKWSLYPTRKNRLKKTLNLVIIRIKKSESDSEFIQFENSAPCKNCFDLIKAVNIKNVIYSSGNDDEFIVEKVRDYVGEHVSVGHQFRELIEKNGYVDLTAIYGLRENKKDIQQNNEKKRR